MTYTIVDSGEAQHGLSVRFLGFLYSLLSSQYAARHCWNPEKRNDVKYGGWSVISALTQGQPGLHWEPVSKGKEKRYEFSNFYDWLGMEDFSNFHVHLQEENIEFYELLWRRVENWQAEESGETLFQRPSGLLLEVFSLLKCHVFGSLFYGSQCYHSIKR